MGWLILAALPGQNHRLEGVLYPQGLKAARAGGLWLTGRRKPGGMGNWYAGQLVFRAGEAGNREHKWIRIKAQRIIGSFRWPFIPVMAWPSTVSRCNTGWDWMLMSCC